jgi:hypothetical protein
MTCADLLWGNPLFVKHVRSRLRSQQLRPFMVVILLVCGCIMWGASVTDSLKDGVAFTLLLFLQGALLLLVGTSEVASAAAGAKHSGTLDFHRISPQSPVATTVGFILGAPIREWVLALITVPFSIAAALMGPPGLDGLLITLLVLVPSALLFHTLAALAGATSPRLRGAGSWVTVLVIILHAGSPMQCGLFTVVPTVARLLNPKVELPIREAFFGVGLPVAVLSLLHILPVLALLFVAAVRKMKSDAIPVYSKPQAVVFHAALAALALGDAVGLQLQDMPGLAGLIVIYFLVLAALPLAWVVTPTAGEFAKGVRRAHKLGLPASPVWSDWAANWCPLGFMCGLTLVAGLWAGLPDALKGIGGLTLTHLAAPLMVAIAAILCFGCAKQYFVLRFHKAGLTYFGLFLFLAWIMPVVVGLLLEVSRDAFVGKASHLPQTITALSPAVGIAFAGQPDTMAETIAALAVATVLALIFVVLSVRAEQRAIAEAAMPPAEEAQAA